MEDFTAGKYVIVSDGEFGMPPTPPVAMGSELVPNKKLKTRGGLKGLAVAIEGQSIVNPPADAVWEVEGAASNFKLKNTSNNKYLCREKGLMDALYFSTKTQATTLKTQVQEGTFLMTLTDASTSKSLGWLNTRFTNNSTNNNNRLFKLQETATYGLTTSVNGQIAHATVHAGEGLALTADAHLGECSLVGWTRQQVVAAGDCPPLVELTAESISLSAMGNSFLRSISTTRGSCTPPSPPVR